MPSILLADDDESIAMVARLGLRRAGYEVTVVDEGRKALEAARATAFDGIVLDWSLPGLDGIDVCRQLMADPAWPRVPIVFLTGMSHEGVQQEALQAGARGVVFKPFDAMTISMLMGRGGWSMPWRHTINCLFSLAIPVGVLIFYFGLYTEGTGADTAARQWYIACMLAFSAGTFLCISLSDLLPELQFHSHDRIKLSAALLLGLGVAHFAAQMEALAHHTHAQPSARAGTSPLPAPSK